MWDNICRICSSPGDYEIFAKIPTYLHANAKEFLNWQKPINLMLEETTGLKVSTDDGLPRSICALCVSYMKHAASFRDQAIRSAMSLKAVALLHEQQSSIVDPNNPLSSDNDKESLLITAQELTYAEGRQIDTKTILNNNTSNGQQDPVKVNKQLLNNKFLTHPPTRQSVDQHIRYLNLLFDKNTNAGMQQKCNKCNIQDCVEADDNLEPEASSDERDEADEDKSKDNIFSYRETNFEEDDIMDMDEVRDAVTVNIPEDCKERKCRACLRRFMFDETYCEHMDTCIEYKFLTFNEEINRLLEIRRNKAVSPHEFIRRMIFCLRKTGEWLKVNCYDMLLSDLLNDGKQRIATERKTSEASLDEQKSKNKTTDSACQATSTEYVPANIVDTTMAPIGPNLFATPQSAINSGAATPTPISVQNNILYVIQRSQSHNSNSHDQKREAKHDNNKPLKKPIAVLARRTKTHTSTTTTQTASDCQTKPWNEVGGQGKKNAERLHFLAKLQKAVVTPPTPVTPQNKCTVTASATPQISVRKDLLEPAIMSQSVRTVQHPQIVPTAVNRANLGFSARCNPCNLYFDTLAALEVHNATLHNQPKDQQQTALLKGNKKNVAFADEPADEARQRIIALFED